MHFGTSVKAFRPRDLELDGRTAGHNKCAKSFSMLGNVGKPKWVGEYGCLSDLA